MADSTPPSGTISLGDNTANTAVGDVFGLIGPSGFSMSEYRNADSGIPATGAIKMSDLLNKKRHSSESESWRAFRYGIFGGVYAANSLFRRRVHIGSEGSTGGDVRYWTGDSGSNGGLAPATPSVLANTGSNIPTSRAGNNSVNTVIWGGMSCCGGGTYIYNKQIQVNDGPWYVPSTIASSSAALSTTAGLYTSPHSSMRYAGNHSSGTGGDNNRVFRSIVELGYLVGLRGSEINTAQFRGNWGPNSGGDDRITDYFQLVLPNKWEIAAVYGNGNAVPYPPQHHHPSGITYTTWVNTNTLSFPVNPWEIVICFACSSNNNLRPPMSARTGFDFLSTVQINWYGSERQGIYTNSSGVVQQFIVPATLRTRYKPYDNLRVVVLRYVGDGFLNSTVNV
jgi:hypothetical protein